MYSFPIKHKCHQFLGALLGLLTLGSKMLMLKMVNFMLHTHSLLQ